MEVFSDYAIVLYAFAFITLMNYSGFEENQKVFLMYTISYIAIALNIFSVLKIELVMIFMVFILLEYLSEDQNKLKYVRRLSDKLLDASYMMIFEYHIFPAIISILLENQIINISNRGIRVGTLTMSFLLLVYALHYCISSKLIVKRTGDILELFASTNPNLIELDNLYELPYEMLISIEDHSYFQRGSKSYSLLSLGYIKYALDYIRAKYNSSVSAQVALEYAKRYIRKNNFKRGYSTLEMQLIKQMGVLSGYESHIIIRKIYELIYVKVILNSVKKFYGFGKTERFKKYLLYMYFKNVSLSVNGHFYSDFFEYLGEDISKWNKEKFFVACCSVKQQKDTLVRVERFLSLAEEYDLDIEEVYRVLGE